MVSRVSLAASLAVVLCSLAMAQTDPVAIVDLGDVGVGSVPGVRIDGPHWDYRSGLQVTGAGDINGDGCEDFLVNSPLDSNYAGAVYLIYGSASGVGVNGEFDLAGVNGHNGVKIAGLLPNDQMGMSVTSLGDFNGDGIGDFAISNWRPDPWGRTDAGSTFVIFGVDGGIGTAGRFDLATLDGSNGFRINGAEPHDLSGHIIAGADDVNRDGLADLLIGATRADPLVADKPGASFLIYGARQPVAGGILDLRTIDGHNGVRIEGAQPGDFAGMVAGLHDVNGDGFPDIAIGARWTTVHDMVNAGAVYVLYGRAGEIGAGGLFMLASMEASEGAVILGAGAGDYLGQSLDGAGDVNCDGLGDLVVTAPLADLNGLVDSGATYLIYGRQGGIGENGRLDLAHLASAEGVIIEGSAAGDYAGFSAREAGDFNGDGAADFILGARFADPEGRIDAGEAYLIYGERDGIGDDGVLRLADLDGHNGVRALGAQAGGNAGVSVSGAGDINADGFQDVLIGAYLASADGLYQAGQSYLIYGHSGCDETEYSSHLPQVVAPVSGVGIVGTSTVSIPPSRCSVGFDAGEGPGTAGASRQVAALVSTDLGLRNLGPRETVANTVWWVESDREDWGACEILLQYVDADIAGLDESRLCVYHGTWHEGPWEYVPGVTFLPERNAVRIVTDQLGYFVLAEAPDPATLTGEEIIESLLGLRPEHPAFNLNGDAVVDIADLETLLSMSE